MRIAASVLLLTAASSSAGSTGPRRRRVLSPHRSGVPVGAGRSRRAQTAAVLSSDPDASSSNVFDGPARAPETNDAFLGLAGGSSLSLSMPPPAECAGSIVDIVSGDERLSTLVTAVVAADLVDALAGEGPLTVFAPTNEAFAALDPVVLEYLLQAENKGTLIEVLTYHVVSGRVEAPSLAEEVFLDSLQGGRLQVKGVVIVGAEVEACNGVVIVVDQVLLPANAAIMDAPSDAAIMLVDWLDETAAAGGAASSPKDELAAALAGTEASILPVLDEAKNDLRDEYEALAGGKAVAEEAVAALFEDGEPEPPSSARTAASLGAVLLGAWSVAQLL